MVKELVSGGEIQENVNPSMETVNDTTLVSLRNTYGEAKEAAAKETKIAQSLSWGLAIFTHFYLQLERNK